MGALAAGAKLLVIARVRRARRQREIADEPAADPRCEDSPTVKSRAGENDAQAKSYRWRSTVVLGLVVLCAIGLAAGAVEVQLLDHPFFFKEGGDRPLRRG